MKTFVETIASTEAGKRGLNQERAILELTELICEVMEKSGVTRSELARRLGKTKGAVTQLLDGQANMTIRTIADIFTSLGCVIRFRDESSDHVFHVLGFAVEMTVSDPSHPESAALNFSLAG